MDSDLTVIVSCCQHPYNLRSICQAIREQTVKPKEIWLHYNGDPGALDRGDLFDEVVCSTGDFKSRFATSLCADTYYSLVCDDDCFLGNKWIENCLKTIERSPGIIGPIGNVLSESIQIKEEVKIVCGKDDIKRITEVDFVSGSYFLKTEWARHLFRAKIPKHSWEYNGLQLAARAWAAEGIRCFMPPQPISEKESHGCCLDKKNVMKELKNQLFIDHEIELGWKPMCLRNRMSDNNSI